MLSKHSKCCSKTPASTIELKTTKCSLVEELSIIFGLMNNLTWAAAAKAKIRVYFRIYPNSVTAVGAPTPNLNSSGIASIKRMPHARFTEYLQLRV